jgi:hypothetical protein
MEEDGDGGGRRDEESRWTTTVAVAAARGRRREGGRKREFPGQPIKSVRVCGVSSAPHRVEYRITYPNLSIPSCEDRSSGTCPQRPKLFNTSAKW